MFLAKIDGRIRAFALRSVSKTVSTLLIVSTLAVSMPAAPRMIVDASSLVRQIFPFHEIKSGDATPIAPVSDSVLSVFDPSPLFAIFTDSLAFAARLKSLALPSLPEGLENAKMPTMAERLISKVVTPQSAMEPTFGQDSDNYTVLGRVVDEKGKPLSDAGICVEPVVDNPTDFDSFIRCIGTEVDGRFSIKKFRNEYTIGKEHFLYVYADNTGVQVMSAINPPFRSIKQYDKTFEGKRLIFGAERVIDVGDVRVQFWFGQASLKFSEYSVGKRNKPIDWSRINLKIRNKDGRTVEFGTLSKYKQKTYIRNNGTELDISLPEGRWKVEIIEFAGCKLITAVSSASHKAE